VCADEDDSNFRKRDGGAAFRVSLLKPLPAQDESIPLAARDVVDARKLLSVIGLEEATPINANAPSRGAAA